MGLGEELLNLSCVSSIVQTLRFAFHYKSFNATRVLLGESAAETDVNGWRDKLGRGLRAI